MTPDEVFIVSADKMAFARLLFLVAVAILAGVIGSYMFGPGDGEERRED